MNESMIDETTELCKSFYNLKTVCNDFHFSIYIFRKTSKQYLLKVKLFRRNFIFYKNPNSLYTH